MTTELAKYRVERLCYGVELWNLNDERDSVLFIGNHSDAWLEAWLLGRKFEREAAAPTSPAPAPSPPE